MRDGIVETIEEEEDHEFADLLHSLGFQRNVAKVITYLAVSGESTSREIERKTGLRQPEISIAMRRLHHQNWIKEWDVKNTEGKGRPSKVYALSTPIDEIIGFIEDERRRESAEAMENIQKLRDLVSC